MVAQNYMILALIFSFTQNWKIDKRIKTRTFSQKKIAKKLGIFFSMGNHNKFSPEYILKGISLQKHVFKGKLTNKEFSVLWVERNFLCF